MELHVFHPADHVSRLVTQKRHTNITSAEPSVSALSSCNKIHPGYDFLPAGEETQNLWTQRTRTAEHCPTIP